MTHPVSLNVRTQSRVLEIGFDDGLEAILSFELLRVYSPSAEVRGHGTGQEVLQTGKRLVNVDGVEPVGNYAVKFLFSDGHTTGLYSWDYLRWLAENHEPLWQDYLHRLRTAGFEGESGRDVPMPSPHAGKCGH